MTAATSRFSFKRITDPANRMGLAGAALVIATLAFGVYEVVPIIRAVRAGKKEASLASNKVELVLVRASSSNSICSAASRTVQSS